jgi:catechol 2,3-dioxygenase-like lactoylglutathione lyase family enzyme
MRRFYAISPLLDAHQPVWSNLRMRTVTSALLTATLAAACGGSEAPAPEATEAPPSTVEGRMLQPLALVHVVENIEESVPFYRDAVGFELMSPPAPLTASALLHSAQADAPNATARAATFTIPGSEMSFMLVDFDGIEGESFTQRLYDPGVTRFSIQVRNIDAAFAAVRDRVISVDTTGGEPVFTQRPANDTRAVMMRDPDGFVFEFVQSGNPIETDVPETSNVYNARSSLALEDTERSLAFYRDILGYEAGQTNPGVTDAVLALEGTPDAVAITTRTQPPGSTNVWFFWEFSGIERTKHEPNAQDPGASAISLLVEGLPALLGEIRAAGITIETPGETPVELGPGRTGVLIRSPDGLLVELIEQQ